MPRRSQVVGLSVEDTCVRRAVNVHPGVQVNINEVFDLSPVPRLCTRGWQYREGGGEGGAPGEGVGEEREGKKQSG